LAEDLLDLIYALNLRQPVLCGLSLGGMIAQQFAATHPEMISGLILCDTAASMTLTLPDKIQTYLFGWSIAPSVRMMGAQRFTSYAFWLAKLMHGEGWFGRDAQTREYVRHCMKSLETKEMVKIYQMILRFRAVDLRCVRVPTLLIYGKQETKSISRHPTYLQEQLAYAQLEIIPNAGHTTNLENPEKFNVILHNFLKILSQMPREQVKSRKV
jgi:pimeloyl-ACP methyl ester carboxylesterase